MCIRLYNNSTCAYTQFYVFSFVLSPFLLFRKVARFVHGFVYARMVEYRYTKGTQVHRSPELPTQPPHTERTYTMNIDNLLDLIIQYKEAAQLIETAQAEQETIKAQIKAEMAQRNTSDLQVGCHKVKLSDFTSTRLDSKAIKAVAPALFTQYSKVVTGQRLTIN